MSSASAISKGRALASVDAAHRDGIQELKALERARDDAHLAVSYEMSLDELTSATGLSRDRALRMINCARRVAAGWSLGGLYARSAAARHPWPETRSG